MTSSLAFALLVVGGMGVDFVRRYEWANATLSSIEPRYARLQGILEFEDDFRRAAAELDENLAKMAYPPDLPADRAASQLQESVRGLADTNGLVVASSQILAIQDHELIELVQVSIVADGTSEELRDFFLALRDKQPRIHVSALVIQAGRGRVSSDKVRTNLTVGVFRLKS